MKPIPYRDHLILPADNRLATLVPHVKTFVDPDSGQQMMVVPHKVDETQVLRNLGYDVKPPVMLSYDFPHPHGEPPFDAQRITTASITTHKRSFVFNGLGTGKTRSTLWAYDFLKKTTPGFGALLVTAPLSTLRQTWAREIELVFPWLRYEVLHGSRLKREAALLRPADVYIINHDGVETITKELVECLPKFSMGCLDELTVYKNANTKLWKATNRVFGEIDRVVGLTGTPMALEALDAYGQIKMINAKILRNLSYSRFREKMQIKITDFKWVDRRGAVDEVYAMMQPAVRFTRDECYDMPPCQKVAWEAQPSKQQMEFFKAMVDGDAIPSHNVIAVNAADKINKLMQICQGTVYDRDHNQIVIDCPSRLKLLEDAVEQSNSKVIVFAPYKSVLDRLVKHLSNRWTVERIDGDVPNYQREAIFTRFRHTPEPHVLVAHPECMSHGLTLTEASTIVWWGPPQSLETYDQANGRITRAGQRHSQLIVNLMATKLEEQIYKLLERRANVQQALLDMFENQDHGDLS